MNKLSWIVLIIISSGLCFALSYFYIAGNDNRPKPEIVVNAAPTTSSVTWYTSIPQRHVTKRNMTQLPIEIIVRSVNLLLRGWVNYFHYGNSSDSFGNVKWPVLYSTFVFLCLSTCVRTGRKKAKYDIY